MRLGRAALILVVSLGFVGLASAQESGNWFTRLFSSAEKTVPANKVDVKTDPAKIPASSSNNRLKQAKADLDRRQEICLKLRDLAIDNGDDDLLRKADLLHERAYDLYVASINRRSSEPSTPDPVAKKGDRK